MHWLQLKSVVVATVILSSIAFLGILIFGLILGCYIYKQKRSHGDASSTKDLISTITPDSSKSGKTGKGDNSVKSDTLSITVEKEPLDDLEEGPPIFDTDDLRPPQTVLAGVGSLRQVSLSILYDLLLSLTNVRLKINPPKISPKNEHPLTKTPVITGILKKDVSMTSWSRSISVDMSRPLSTTRHLSEQDREDIDIQAAILEDLLKQDVKFVNETEPPIEKAPVSTVTPRNVPEPEKTPSEKPPCEIPVFMSEDEMTDTLRDYVTKQLDYIFADDNRRHETFRSVMEAMVCAPTAQLLTDAIYRMFRVNHGVIQQWKVEEGSLLGIDPVDGQGDAKLNVDFSSNNTTLLWEGPSYGSDLFDSVSRLVLYLREEGRQPTYSEYVAIHLAHYKLSRGCQLSHLPFKSLGNPGFSPHTQTYVSLTDPGKGHIVGTTRFKKWMDGTILNVERPEKDLPSADMIDLRVPPLLNLAQVRLHVGSSAPTTYFIGKAMKEEFEEQFEKDVHMAACTATTAFNNGASGCKICVCGLTSSQAFRFMTALRSKVIRQPGQYLSAAWNLNRPITDDHQRQEPVKLTERKDIALTAAEITSLAGFDTVILCAATAACPARDIVSQMGFDKALTFTHEAHMRGLITNFSVGFKSDDIKNAVFAGVDVIGTGDARVIRYKDEDKGMEENISKTLQNRDDAAKSVRGRGVHLLVRLDTMYFEGSISEAQNNTRLKLFKALEAKCEHDIKAQLKAIPEVDNFPDDSGQPIGGTAARLTSAQAPLLKDVCESIFQWNRFISRLEKSLESNDYNNIAEEYKSEPWCGYRQRYREKMGIATGRD